MKLAITCALGLAAALTVASSTLGAPVNQAFTYQGLLKSDGLPFTGTVKLEFSLYTAATGGSQVGSTVLFATHPVEDGLVSVELDFGSTAFPGNDRWLEAEVDDVILTPRTKVLPSPYAMYAGDSDKLEGLGLADLDDEFVNEGEANSVTTPMLQSDVVTTPKLQDFSVTSNKVADDAITSQQIAASAVTEEELADESVGVNHMASDIDASGIGFNAASVNDATIRMGPWTTDTSTFLSLHNGDCELSGTGTHNEYLRVTNNMSGEVRVALMFAVAQGFPDTLSNTYLVPGGTSLDIQYPHYYPFMLIVSEAASRSDWTCAMWLCENDGWGSYVAIDHAQ